MKYKVGDKVRIKSLDWYNENKDEYGYIDCGSRAFFTKMSNLCGKIATIKEICKTNCYRLEEYDFDWTDEMIEGLVERNGKTYLYKIGDRVVLKGNHRCATITDLKYNSFGNLSYYIKIDNDKDISVDCPTDLLLPYDNMIEGFVEETKPKYEDEVNGEYYSTPKYLVRPNGYQFVDENGNVINAMKIVLEKKTDKEIAENNTNVDMGEVSDGYHTFNELYEYRMLYNAALFNEFAKQGLYDVHKSRKHSDGEYPFGDSNWFIVMAELPTGQISNHYEMKDWDKFQIPEKPLANKWDEHSPRDVANRLTSFTTPKKEYPKTYCECKDILGLWDIDDTERGYYKTDLIDKLQMLLICRDAYWKIAGEEMGLGKPWEPDWEDENQEKYIIGSWLGTIQCLEENFVSHPLAFPTEEMRDAFYENFKELIEQCKELL